MLIELGNTTARVLRGEDDEIKWLDRILSFKDGSFKSRVYGDGRVHLFSDLTHRFPSGLVTSVVKRAKKDKQQLDLVDRREVPCVADPTAIIDWLRDHQLDAVQAARRAPRGVFHHVTGSGKTEIIVGLTEVYPVRWLILVHKKDLLYQVRKRFAWRTGERIGIWGDGKCELGRRITVAMFQSVHAAMKARSRPAKRFLDRVQAVAVDECHVVPAGSFWRVTQALKGAYYRYGFSGTPFARTDKKSLYVVAALGPRIHRASAEELVEKGWIAKPRIQLTPVVHQPSNGATWDLVYKERIVRNKDRNRIVGQIVKMAKKPLLLFVKALEHGKLLEKQLRAAGERVEFVWGEKKTPQRRAAIHRLLHGDIDVLICNVIFQEGIDIPELRSIIIASAGKSAIMVLQNTGRGTRRHDQTGKVVKDEFTVYDFQDVGCGCHNRHKSCKWLEKHTKERLAAYAMEKYPVFVKKVQKGALAA